jgi:hypothetical protein
VIVCDTGPIVAAALADDARHHERVELFTGLHLAGSAFGSQPVSVDLQEGVVVFAAAE